MIWNRIFGRGQDKAAARMLEDAVTKAREHILAQKLRAVSLLSGVNGADEFEDDPEKMLAVELPFMWGWNHAYAKAAGDWPTTPSMRATLQMTDYLIKHHSFDFQRARAEASALDAMWNEAEPLFEAISQRGEESYAKPDEPILAQAISNVIDFNRSRA